VPLHTRGHLHIKTLSTTATERLDGRVQIGDPHTRHQYGQSERHGRDYCAPPNHSSSPLATRCAHTHTLSLSLSLSWHKTRGKRGKVARVSKKFAPPRFCLALGECESFIENGRMRLLWTGGERPMGHRLKQGIVKA
jgi:hypothetical protein